MGTTAEKLTYLNETKGKIKDSINLTGANISSNDTFRSYAVKLRDGLVNVLNNGTATLYNNFPKVSGTGSNISLSNTLEAPMFINKLDGDTLQDGTPTPSTPVDIQSVEGIQNISVSGKNLLKTTNATITGSNYNISINDGLISLTNTHVDCSIDLCGGVRTGSYLPGYAGSNDYHLTNADKGTYKISLANFNADITGTSNTIVSIYTNQRGIGCYFSSSERLNGTTSFTLQDNEYIKSIYLWTNGTNTYNSVSFNLQLEKGSTATIYEPYQSQEYEVNLEGKNLFDKNAITPTSYFIQDGSIVTSSGNYCISDYIPVIAGQNYTYQGLTNVGTDPYSVYYDNNKEIVSTFKQQTGINTITIPNNVAFVRFSIRNAGGDDNTFMIEYGNQATSYVPYREPIKMYDGDKFVGYTDNWSIVRNNKEKIFNGSETGWTQISLGNLYSYLIDGQIDDIDYVSNVINYKSNYYKGILNANRYQDNTFFVNSNKRIVFTNNSITSVNDWKTNLATNNISVVYPLATPTTEAITDTNLISQLNELYNAKSYNGQTNISVNGQLPMILEVSALKDEI